MLSFLRKKLLFIFLLPIFFVFNGFRDNYPLVPVPDALKLAAIYIVFSLLFYFIFLWIYKDKSKAALGSFAIMFIQFFFGSMHDLLKSLAGELFITRYSFLLPFLTLLLLLFFILLKKKQWQLKRVTYYLNFLFIILLASEVIFLVLAIRKTNTEKLHPSDLHFTACKDCPKPDIYFIVMDEYAGNEVLTSTFNFDNSAFTSALGERNFHIVKNSFSNYNSTPFSIASVLNMDYLNTYRGSHKYKKDVNYCYKAIRNSRVLEFLTENGYTFTNYSIFNFKGARSPIHETFVPQSTRLFISQTFLRRLEDDLGHHLVTTLKLTGLRKKINLRDLENNKKLLQLTNDNIREKKEKPKFVYTHLMMPHYPYYFDSRGNPYEWETLEHFNSDTARYIQYLQYSNAQFLQFIDTILAHSTAPPIIILMGDHGFRQLQKPVANHSIYNNFSAVLLPRKDYTGFYDSISLVNKFRVILNTEFRQNFPMLRDSTIFINNKSDY